MRCLFVVSFLVTLFCAVCSSNLSAIHNLSYFTDRHHDALMQRIVVSKTTREVYVGARNAIYHFDENLSLKSKISTGPELDNIQCLHPSLPCDHKRVVTDNDNKILDILTRPSGEETLISCGSLFQGMCRMMPMSNINLQVWIGQFNDSMNFVGGRESVVGFFAPGPQHVFSLYSASTYDDRPLGYSMSMSSKILVLRNRTATFQHSYEFDSTHTSVNFNNVYKKLYKVNYIYGFSYLGFTYFVTTQSILPESEVVETRLVRVCQEDTTFFSYTEMPLRCQRGLDVFNLATAANLGPAGSVLKRKLKKMGTEVKEILYVSFGMTVPDHGHLLDKSKGSVVCSFPMDQVIQSITNATKDCYHAEPRTHLLKHVVGVDKKCDKHEEVEVSDEFCGTGFNPYIEGREAIPGGFRLHLDHHVTSLAVSLQFGKTIAIMGTYDGEVIKEILDKRIVYPLYVINIGKDSEGKNHSIQGANAFDHDQGNIYFLAGNKVIKFPIGSCSMYRDCGTCLTSEDPLSCGWCGDHCAHLEECGAIAQISRHTCPPIIYHIEPISGPIDGGTDITILGDNLGSSQSGETNSNIEVLVAGHGCDILLWEKEKLICRTQYVPFETSGPISVWVKDISWSAGQFDMNGTTSSSSNFSFLVPKLYGVYPPYGPLSGGTNVTLFGEKLNIGKSYIISTAGVLCANYSVSENIAWCITSPFPEDSTNSRGTVEVIIDQAVLHPEILHDPNIKYEMDFQFLPDPDIFGIHPQTALVSGITNLTVTGTHLNSVAFPKMIVIVTSSLTGETYEKRKPCTLKGKSGVEMTCPTPSIDIPGLHAPTDRAPLVAHLAFEMDGVKRLRDLPIHNSSLSQLLYYPDPVFSNPLQTAVNNTHLEIKAIYLDLALTPRDVKVFLNGRSRCNVTSLTKESLFCVIPPLGPLTGVNTSKHFVEVTIGYLNFSLGYVDFAGDIADQDWQKITGNIAYGIVGASILVLILSFGIFWLRRRYRAKKNPTRFSVAYIADENTSGNRRRQEINDYQDLNGRSLAIQRPSVSPSETACISAAENNDYDVNDETLYLLRSENILIQREFLTLAEVIGEGYFGIVYKGELNLPGKEENLVVAAKTLHNSATRVEQDKEAFLQEGLTMKDFHHHNVLTLIGVCFENNGSPMVIIPYMKYGDLLSFIRDENQEFIIKDFMTFGVDIAAGMNYLAGLKFVHRDLAARNCMLAEDYTVKVADFGLSRDIYERDYYSSDNKKKLPVKWMAPESLEKGTYTTKSDVWSYAIVIWELFTRGVLPYPDVDNWDLLNYLKTGRRMLQPSYCPDLLYQLMLKCWDFDPRKRPDFAELEEAVKGIIAKLEMPKKRVSMNVTYVNCPSFSEEYATETRPSS